MREWCYFHLLIQIIAIIYYIAMRVRVDILLVVVFLATRVHNTNNLDVEKLKRLSY